MEYKDRDNRWADKDVDNLLLELDLLRKKYEKVQEQLFDAEKRNQKLIKSLTDSKEQLKVLKEEVDKLCAPPNSYGAFLELHEDGAVDVNLDGRKMRVSVHPKLDAKSFKRGQQLILNESLNVIDVAGWDEDGEVATIKEFLDERRVIALVRADEDRVVQLSESLASEKLAVGDDIMINTRTYFATEKLPKSEIEQVVLEEVPNITYDDIGGLKNQIEELREAIEMPFLYPEEFKEHRLSAPKGILLYGPPGCGKTMIAKAVANSLAKQIEARTGKATTGYFLNIKGPELLNKYVGETEHKIREIFSKAKKKAADDVPVIVFFDEMDSLFRMRGSGISSDVETTIVAQFLSEIDGVEGLKNVIVIGASNRQDLIDPAVLRPGRLDIKIRVERPDMDSARDIFSKYLGPDLPYSKVLQGEFDGDAEKLCEHLVEKAVETMYATTEEMKFLEVTYAKGDKEILYMKDFVSGAMIENIVRRAKSRAVKRYIMTKVKGIELEDVTHAVIDEFRNNEDLPNTTNPDDWAKIAGRKGEKIVNARTLISNKFSLDKPVVEDVTPSQYL
ncbi:MAG: proteasome ATPase [Candidatus Methylomirabilis sp.]|nr:proteasome ATPase [Deltaproteobacteria bacterium]